VSDWFTPTNQVNLASGDLDFGAGGAAVVLDVAGGPYQHLVVGGGKYGTLYLLNGDHLGAPAAGDGQALQSFAAGTGGTSAIFGTPAFWNNILFLAPATQPLLAYSFDIASSKFTPTASPAPASQSGTRYGFPGATPSVSASGIGSNGIVWTIDATNYCTNQAPGCGPAVLHAYDALNLAHELWNSSMSAADKAGNAVKFTVPTVANGKVYIGTRGNNTGGVYGSTTVAGELEVYGLKPN
jgi:hypothetical protein